MAMSTILANFTLKLFIMIRLKELREEYALTQTQLAKELGFAQRTISNWENNISDPNIQTLIILSNYFHVTIDYLIGKDQAVLTEENSIENISNEERELLKDIRSLTPAQQSQVAGYVQGLISINAQRSTKNG